MDNYSQYIREIEYYQSIDNFDPIIKVVLEIPWSQLEKCDGRRLKGKVDTFIDTKFELPEDLFRLE